MKSIAFSIGIPIEIHKEEKVTIHRTCPACIPRAAQLVTAVGATMADRDDSQRCVAKGEHVSTYTHK